MNPKPGLRDKIWPVVRVASGNFLEMYDFFVFGYYAAAIGRVFFPRSSEFASLMLSLATFGAGFLMRPLGAIFLGTYIDHRGRRAGLLLTLGLMSIGTLSIALTPGFALLGVLAPLLVVVGDYYMFGEYEERVKLKRLVRDFAINSKEDLVHSQRDNPGSFDKYSDVAMQYLPASAAYALADLAPLLREGRQVQVALASELTPERLKSDDIIYVGLLSGMGKLSDAVFSQSRFAIGESYDQIIDRKTGRTYTSEAFRAAPSDQMYRDYGFFSTFEGPAGNRIAILSGSRDTAVMGVAEALTQMDRIAKVEKKTGGKEDFEALFEVKGQKHVNLEAQVLASYEINSSTIWSGAPANVASYPTK